MKEKELQQLTELAKPLNEWLQKNYSPMCSIVITFNGAEVKQGILGVPFKTKD